MPQAGLAPLNVRSFVRSSGASLAALRERPAY